EDQGLISPKREGTARVFSSRDRVRLKLALRGKRLGFSIAEIRELFELYDVSRDEKKQLEEFLSRLDRRRAHLEQQREDIEVMLNEINFFANQCRRLLKVKADDGSTKEAA
ncbi:MAG TPA: MerR family DNA-binding transcriptional regulator, partial [Burkholderiales bacterium]|nr:MerR family DNA-binding transcriptional regulator [Burkholderiales bacterium]